MLKTKTIEVDPSIKKDVDDNDGYCPCEIWHTEDTKCMCKAFRDQEIGLCNCGRFVKIKFEERYINDEYGTTTLYFIAPKELVEDRYSDAEHATISIEYLTGHPSSAFATAMISPTKDGMDYDWSDWDVSGEIIQSILDTYAEEKENG